MSGFDRSEWGDEARDILVGVASTLLTALILLILWPHLGKLKRLFK